MVAFDLDGTLIGDDLQIRPRVVHAVAAMRERGIQGCIVTGRMFRAALPFARALGFETPIICYQGAAVVDPVKDEVLLDTPLPNAAALEVAAYAKSRGLHVQLYKNDRYYCEERNRYSDYYARLAGSEPIVVPSLAEEFRFSDATKACIIAEPEVVDREIDGVRLAMGNRAYVTRSIPWFIEVMDPKVDKGKAFELVAKTVGVPLDATMAVGDSWNDVPLLRTAGFGVAMGSSPAELRAVSGAVVADVANDGVAEAIERYVLQ
ncbi:MAG TPA: Cof-type HAD-IIB family hydrolase [Candidatus Rubrimentiphilum sp.]|nr:Cof-type HAD-IIB family hydrolase [Candidatus Rubrimentiphilum sp.]